MSILETTPTPREVVLDLLGILAKEPVSIAALLEAGSVMDFSAVAVRVAVTRLAAAGLIESPERSRWRLAGDSPWSRERERWRRLSAAVKPWNGEWIVAIATDVSRSDRTVWSRNERAMLHRGFRELQRDLFARPGNLKRKLPELKEDLVALGASKQIRMMRVSEIDFDPDLSGWNVRDHQAKLKGIEAKMTALMQTPSPRDNNDLCRAFWLLGRQAIRILNNDPLLPDSMADPGFREAVIARLPEFIERGRREWLKRLEPVMDASKKSNRRD